MTRRQHALDLDVADLAVANSGLVPLAPLLHRGHSKEAIAMRVTKQTLVTVRRGVRLRAGVEYDLVRRALAAALIVPDGWISHTTALQLHGCELADDAIHLTAPTQHRLRGVVMHQQQAPQGRSLLSWVEGARASSPMWALIESAAVLNTRALTVSLDWLVQHRKVDLTRLHGLATANQRFRGRPVLLELLDERINGFGHVRSFFEVDLDQLLRRNGMPAPTRNCVVRTPSGRRVLDAAWPALKIALEADSWKHHSNTTDWGRTRIRDRELIALGWRIIPVVYADISNPEQLLRHLGTLLVQS
jgi:very-short-patch-repair endonuclease